MLGFRVPIGGGGYLRTLSYPILHTLFSQIEDLGEPIVLYLRAWELNYEQPRIKGPLLAEFFHYLNLHKMEPRLTQLLTDFSFGSVREAIQPIRTLADCPKPSEDSESAVHNDKPLSAAV
jgi:hypothetical protein